jgi:hypothetical protein
MNDVASSSFINSNVSYTIHEKTSTEGTGKNPTQEK